MDLIQVIYLLAILTNPPQDIRIFFRISHKVCLTGLWYQLLASHTVHPVLECCTDRR